MSNDPKTRASKVFTSLEGNDEFSVMSIDPDARKLKVELDGKRAASEGRPEPVSVGVFSRLFRRLFRG
ncbi:hypothetical protein JY651_43975 [Pyxidicoccus parkwayensis]|uniref:Uncharacterized protein n=1 Tax=Pyxidicoccus parkwayensis TaxID=2813578 RepID=A0ABX7NU65_9BACT|nr:hypothetical protein [Pyxidicoccus parkwaysis]QSQ22033.1 hypothetical protein JY651_43975 [Pyxidicoccus parkwaysis]